MDRANVTEHYGQINARIRKIKIPGMTKEDVQQECMIAILEYLDTTIAPTKGGVNNSINRALYHLIKNNVTFEGCNVKNKNLRRSISQPISGTVHFNEEDDDKVYDHREMRISQDENIAADDMIQKFKAQLTSTELKIYELMIIGNTKPKQVCQAIYGEVMLNNTKTVSNHMVKIRNKFLEFYYKETGVWLTMKK